MTAACGDAQRRRGLDRSRRCPTRQPARRCLEKLLTDRKGKAGPFMLKRYWVSTIEASRKVEGRAYVCFDAHRSNDDRPHVFVTQDFGKTWRNITGNLPPFGSTRCLRRCRQSRPAVLRHRIRRFHIAQSGHHLAAHTTIICRQWPCTKSPSIRRPVKSSPPRTAAACGSSTFLRYGK